MTVRQARSKRAHLVPERRGRVARRPLGSTAILAMMVALVTIISTIDILRG